MDTINTSPTRTSQKVHGILTAALGVSVGLWLIAIAAGTAMAQAPQGADRPGEPVAYSDLDLRTSDGANILLRRLELAARRACGPEPVHSPLMPRSAGFHHRCVTNAVDAAVAQIDAPVLAAAHSDEIPDSATLASR